MKFQEMNSEELREVNGGLLGGLLGSRNRGESASQNTLIGGIGLNLSSESESRDGDRDSFGLGLNLSNIGMFDSANRR
ncbi:hypothetical protein MM239_08185 [Belliella sp. DSM 111904]|uniref:Bacteriocin n=1 Tax=Belliella filtrata TaxID=2923435 RepID=A0ABS9UYZ2_9BACT|nr:hypothetical protein [Belliella filtrata]MCH7409368.1 hypothetical protein [Belliella filtrata]